MSKFFRDTVSDDEEQPEQQANEAQTQLQAQNTNMRNKIIGEIFSSEDEEDRVVITEKEKRYIKLRELIKQIKDKMKNNDFVSMLDFFEKLNKEIEKGEKVFEREGGVPRLYIRILCQIENHVLSITGETKKKLSKTNNLSYNTLKQKIKKHNLSYKEKIDEFLSHPVNTDQSDAEAQELKNEGKFKGELQAAEPSSEEEDDDKSYLQSSDPMVRRKYWLKKIKPTKQVDAKQEDKRQIKDSDKQEIDYELKFKVAHLDDIVVDFAPDAVVKTLERIQASRGVNKNQIENIVICDKMVAHFSREGNLKKTLEILLIMIGLQLEQAKKEGAMYITRQSWKQIFSNVNLLYSLYRDTSIAFENLLTYSKLDSEATFNEWRFLNTLLTNYQALETELNKAFQFVDFYTPEYAERLSDLYQLVHLCQQLLELFQIKNDASNVAKMSFKLLESIYFIPPQIISKLLELPSSKLAHASPVEIFGTTDFSKKMEHLFQNVYKGGEEEYITKANLYWVYNLALHGKYNQAHDFFLAAISFDAISLLKPPIQLLYNRALIQLGIAAFREGLIPEAHMHLADLMSRDKILKDLLSQNYARQPDADIKQNIPYHLSINVEVVEFVYLVSAMLLEMPNIQADPFDEGHKVISRKFKQLCSYYSAQPFNGQPENMRDMIYAASKELGKGDWQKCWDWLKQIPIWSKLPNLEEVQALIQLRTQEQALKCYLFTFRNAFTNVSINHLQTRFALKEAEVNQIVFKMIYNGEIKASVELGESPYLIFSNEDVSQSKRIAQALIEKLNTLSKVNEKLLDVKVGSFGFQPDKEGQDAANKQKKKTVQKYKKQSNPLTKKKQ